MCVRVCFCVSVGEWVNVFVYQCVWEGWGGGVKSGMEGGGGRVWRVLQEHPHTSVAESCFFLTL